jgi:hypothetical protein
MRVVEMQDRWPDFCSLLLLAGRIGAAALAEE